MTATFGSTHASDVSIDASSSNGGSISQFGLRYYAQNSAPTYSATPLNGFEVADCIIDGVSQGAVSTYSFPGITTAHIIRFIFTDKAVALKDVTNMINYQYYEGSWSSVPDFSQLVPLKTGTLSSLTLAVPGRASDYFGIHYSGYIKAPADGQYTFYMTADDGSRLLIDGVQIVANQCQPETSGTIMLRAGYHSFTVDFFQIQVSESITLKWSSPTFTKRPLTGLVSGTIDNGTAVVEYTDDNAKMVVTSREFKFSCPGESKIEVEVYTLTGMLIEKQTLSTTDGLAALPDTNLKAGLYCIVVNAGDKTMIRQKAMIIR